MTGIGKRVRGKEPGVRCERTPNADPDSRFRVRTADGRTLGWGPNRMQAWLSALALLTRTRPAPALVAAEEIPPLSPCYVRDGKVFAYRGEVQS